MEDEYAFYIDQEGRKISSEDVASHIGLASLILDNNETLKSEFIQTGTKNADEFLVRKKGYMKGSVIGNYYKAISYDASSISEIQKNRLAFYIARGFKVSKLPKKNRDEGR